ncbi:ABC transporter six-transmembrane domain-containing protein [Hahella sp. HN01]|uniref:ABC transporter six-transmembrane domain-containing protein n=1 Tax=Hahella sp. HN01 TaxID=2847262 RepID=UPI001C1E9DC1|nr:ABC transporter six-transmembrane domain-containing protein [Hahella sp. HN01]MBU6951970.1 ABC transporter six-transmembrane domain-containing protein [Hahella sp. HN01]
MNAAPEIGLCRILKEFRWRVGLTWLLVFLEYALDAAIPLLIGLAIDDMLSGGSTQLAWLVCAFVLITAIAVLRRFYDTRAYSKIRVKLGSELDQRQQALSVSIRNARLHMATELVDFIEKDTPELFAAVITLVASAMILSSFSMDLAMSALGLLVAMLTVYLCFHHRFFRLNGGLNSQMERQVSILSARQPGQLLKHLHAIRHWQVRLSDAESIVYGLIFLLITAFVVLNLWLCSSYVGITTGALFSIVTYSWQFGDAAVSLPTTLQSWSRLHEITIRLNNPEAHGAA